MKSYDGIVIGAGHAGVEAAFALAKKHHKVALISLDINKVAMMPCNPSIGGPAKGIITREIDALGGMQGILTDQATIQIKMLNESRGPSVRALRAQVDKEKYSLVTKQAIIKNKNIDFIATLAQEIVVNNGQVKGVQTSDGLVRAKIVIVTTGTYMASFVMRGNDIKQAGPAGQKTTTKLSKSIAKLGLKLQRLKTGTPPRVYANSINWNELEKEFLPKPTFNFSHWKKIQIKNKVHCYLGHSSPKTHKIVKKHLHQSSMYSKALVSNGPRYCPSFEDKVIRFSNKNRHQIFYEPETIKQDIIYLQGLSSAMPIEVQKQILKTLPGLKNAKVQKWGYAIEYDAINPKQLRPSLELKNVKNLYFAGQVNGTSGYEEAAAQGLVAGINAALRIEKKNPLFLPRNKAYIGVLIDDLVTKGTKEPYRMLTSRAEYRLLLRNDNADQRLAKIAFEIGMISANDYQIIKTKYNLINEEIARLKTSYLSNKSDLAKKYGIKAGPSLAKVITRPEVNINDVSSFKYINEVSVILRLEGYIKKQEVEAQKMLRLERLKIPLQINYQKVINLASEARQKLEEIRPETIGQAKRISGINPADIQMLMFYLEYKRKQHET